MAATAAGTEPCAVTRITGSAGRRSCTAFMKARPSMSGIFQSVTTTSAPRSSSATSAAAPAVHTSHVCPARPSAAAMTSAMRGSSSTTSTRVTQHAPAAGS
jgi:hypothetical protein